MTPNPDSPRFIRHSIPDEASHNASQLRDIYQLLKANIEALVWPDVTIDCLTIDRNTYLHILTIAVAFVDANNHTHTIKLVVENTGSKNERQHCEYEFEGSIDAPVISFRSYAEWLMLQLWEIGIDAELCKCDRGLHVSADIDSAYSILSQMLDIVTNNIKPIDWFLNDEPIWQFYETYNDLKSLLPKLQDEALKDRWRNVKPNNFHIVRNTTSAYISLEYGEEHIYTMKFVIGLSDGSFAANRPDKFIDMYYQFENLATDTYTKSYYESESKSFAEVANCLLHVPFSYKALLFHGENDFYINLYREYAFQKFCLMLDILIPLISEHKAKEPYIPPHFQEKKKELENLFGSEFEIHQDPSDDLVFSRGRFIEHSEPNEDSDEDAPF